MTLSVSTIGDNPFIPGAAAETYVPDQLIAGNLKLVTQPVVVASGLNLNRGQVVMQSTNYSVSAAAGTNTGNGTIGSVSAVTGALVGTYTLEATSSTVFSVTNPEGVALNNATVAQAYSDEIGFTLAQGTAVFVAGDNFTVNVVDSIGNFVVATASGLAASPPQAPAILADAANATSGAVSTGAYVMGEFNINYLTFDASFSAESLVTALRPYGLFVKTVVTAADPGTYTGTLA
jgi:hypothetical protein